VHILSLTSSTSALPQLAQHIVVPAASASFIVLIVFAITECTVNPLRDFFVQMAALELVVVWIGWLNRFHVEVCH
jgi:hypothetical protein